MNFLNIFTYSLITILLPPTVQDPATINSSFSALSVCLTPSAVPDPMPAPIMPTPMPFAIIPSAVPHLCLLSMVHLNSWAYILLFLEEKVVWWSLGHHHTPHSYCSIIIICTSPFPLSAYITLLILVPIPLVHVLFFFYCPPFDHNSYLILHIYYSCLIAKNP